MSISNSIKVGILGASGYTGADLVRLAAMHPHMELSVLTANSHAGKKYAEVYPHLGALNLPDLIKIEEANWSDLDVIFCGLPHGTTQKIVASLPKHVKVIDLSADFRLRDTATYQQWYGHEHFAPHLQEKAVYGLPEHYREQIKQANLVACPGCYPTAALLMLIPLLKAKLLDINSIIIDAKSGLTGAGRGLKQNTLFAEAGEGMSVYGVAGHRHAPEIEQELTVAQGADVMVSFTPHLIPMNRGEFVSTYANLTSGASIADIRKVLSDTYRDEPFVRLLEEGAGIGTQYVRGSNQCLLSAHADRVPGRVLLFSTLDNLVKGSSGQAIQNMNLMFDFAETLGLNQQPMFP
ncbi:MAG: N-acetyl-gamma-glutamyl-phosphate reductase [Oceanospirillaceae bacterium]|nr:N-acetyl-gamma-glutamyl-phosphate reductase [Oceanospirillaceae bacterium]